MSDTDQGRLRPSWCRWKRSYRWRTCNPKKTRRAFAEQHGSMWASAGKKHAKLTSNHSVAPTLPYSPALQLAKTILLLGVNPSDNSVWNAQTSSSSITYLSKITIWTLTWRICYLPPPFFEWPWPVPPVLWCQLWLWCSLHPRHPSGLPEPHNDLQIKNHPFRQRNQHYDFGSQRWTVPGSVNPLMMPKTLWISLLTSTLFTSTVMFSWPPSL